MAFTFTDPRFLWALLLIPLAWGLAALAPGRGPVWRQRLGLGLRTLVLLLLVLALAGLQLRRTVEDLTVVFLVDASDSMPAGSRDAAARYLREALAAMPEGDRAAIVLFGRNALVERTASDLRVLEPLGSVPIRTRTDIADAIQLGLALLPADSQKRLVLISDGQENEGDAREVAALVAVRGVTLDTVPLGGGVSGPEVQIGALEAPGTIPLGQRFEVVVRLESNVATTVRLRLFDSDRLLYDEPVAVPAGGDVVRIPVEATESGFQRFRALIEPLEDTRPENNEAAAFTTVTGAPRVAIVATDPEEGRALAAALEGTRMSVDLLPPGSLPQELTALAAYDAIVLANVPAPAIPSPTQAALDDYVRELGRGLLMVGGPESFGAGQWLRTEVESLLPVDMEVRPRDQEANIALVLAVDKSGSMGRCHCDDPANAAEQNSRRISGLPKVDIAKDAVIQATAALGQTDFVGVVAFDDAARWALQTQRFPGVGALQDAVAPIAADGSTNIFAGLSLAQESLTTVDARVKHIILLTDGWSRAGDYQALAERMREAGITLSVVAAGSGSAQTLDELAREGGGRYYPAASLEEVPQIFLRETIRVSGRYIIEEPFAPALVNAGSPVLQGLALSAVPLLEGYNGSTIKADATEVLRTPQGDPLLATRRVGLGRTAAWTSDLSGRWAAGWLDWPEFQPFVSQLVAWTLPERGGGDLDVQVRQEGGEQIVEVVALDETGRPAPPARTQATVIGPDGTSQTVEVAQVGAGRYRATLPAERVGAYALTVTQQDDENGLLARAERGFAVPYSPEYRIQPPDTSLLATLATVTDGQVRGLDDPVSALFESPAQAVTRATDLWATLLLLALLLFPLDIAARRLAVGRREWEGLQRRLGGLRPTRRAGPDPAAEPVLGTLFEAKKATGGRTVRRAATPVENEAPPAASAPVNPAPETPPAGGDTLARLREARERQRRRMRTDEDD